MTRSLQSTHRIRIIVATFASNVDRVQQVINSAYKYGRKVVIEGRSMVNVIGTAQELGYINIPDGTLIDIEQLKNYQDEETVLITTGSQGESMAALIQNGGLPAPEGVHQAERRGDLKLHARFRAMKRQCPGSSTSFP